MVADRVRENALRLLWAMHDYQAKGRIGKTVFPNDVAHHAGLDHGTPPFDAAVNHLVDEGALIPTQRRGGAMYYTLTRRGLNMLLSKE